MAGKKRETNDWRELNRSSASSRARRKPVSWRARLRTLWTWTKRLAAACALVGLGYAAYYAFERFSFGDLIEGSGEPIKRIEMKTDGAISGAWLNSYLKIPRGSKLSEVNIFEVKRALDMLTQIRSSKVERVYPDVLRITISEHKPAAKIVLKIDYENRLYAVSPEGVFFRPTNIPAETLDSLKFITGLNPRFEGGKPANYENMPALVEFLDAAQKRMPAEYAKWKSVDVSQAESITLPLFTVEYESSVKCVFKKGDYRRQFDRLEYILRYMKENPIEAVEKIDLTLEEWAVVKFDKPKSK